VNGVLEGAPEVVRLLARARIATVADVLARAERVRDLPGRSNHLLRVGRETFFVKREKRRRRSREAIGLATARAAGVPCARVAFVGADAREGALVGTFGLGRARPLDDLLREGRLDGRRRRDAMRALAAAAAALHGAGLHHRDLYLNHAYVDPAARRTTVVLIDLERLGRHRTRLGRWVVKDLAAIQASIPEGTLAPAERHRFLLEYLRERGLSARSVGASLARRVARKAARLRRHVPRTPVGPGAA